MTAWHLTDWTWKEIKDSPRLRSLATRAGAPIRELKQFQEFVKRDLHRVGVLRRGRRLNETFRLLEGLSVFHQGNRAIQNKSAPDWQRSGAKLHKFSPIGESISYTAKQLNRSIRSRPSGKIGLVSELIMKCIQLLNVRARFAQLACGVEFASKSGNTTRNLRGGGFLSAPPCYAFRWLLRHSPMATGPGTPPQRIRPDCLAGFSFGWRTA